MMRATLTFAAAAMMAFAAAPSFAALGSPSENKIVGEELAVAGLETGNPGIDPMVTGSACVPPEEQYIPSFIRDSAGEIVGIHYTIIEYEC
ncbi:hypothetical protein [Rhizobium sp. CC-YZS058]|uniref:hypothetical protein n=1 Tax=Rhizobium sp. CC-YZS058 TaxID=3042153 RepID=UPI002B061C29|nr:hypothetical protein [Rhizobium sp. CC-YZS058]MEA3534844.1 hypothetical protein [Rhizobium sp. CC-YZS058]